MNHPIVKFIKRCGWASVSRCTVIVCITVVLPSLVEAKDIRAERVYNWDFQRDNDVNFDQMPDGWKRRLDREHPSYIDIRIVPRSLEESRVALQAQNTLATWIRAWETGRWPANYIAETTPEVLANVLDRSVLDNCLEISMDGGAAELVSPTFPMQHRFSYTLQAALSCTALDGHTLWVELQLLDASYQVLQVLTTDSLQGTVDWQRLSTQIASSPSPELRFGRIHVRVAPHSSTALTGKARFDSIGVYRMPRLSLTSELPYYVARPGEAFRVDCNATGIRDGDESVRFELRDHVDELLRQESVALTRFSPPLPAGSSEESILSTDSLAGSAPLPPAAPHYVTSRLHRPALDGHAAWTLQLAEPGLYRVKVNLGIGGAHSPSREILIGVMPVHPRGGAAGPFGWSLHEVGGRLHANEIPELVRRFGAGWIKLPVWLDPQDAPAAERLVGLIERLQGQGVHIVGKLDHPPAELWQDFGESGPRMYAVNTFRDPQVWQAALQPTLTRVGMKLNWFQLGADDDCSFAGTPTLPATITGIRNKMQSYCQKLNLAFNWSWNDAPPEAAAAWNAIHFVNSPQLSAAELEAYLSQQAPSADLWVTLDPLDGERYPLLDRVRDLTERIVVIKRSPVTAAFVNDPLRPELRLFTPRQSVGEMLIPWHTLVSSVGAASYQGSIELPGRSVNHVFTTHHERGSETLMLLWNDQPTVEHVYLGEQLQASDVWGKPIAIETTLSERGTPQQQLSIGPWPIFVRGVDLHLIRFEQQFQLQLDNLDNALTVAREIPVRLTNTLPQNAIGSVTVVSPKLLNADRSQTSLQLSSGLEQEKSLPVFLRPDASAGKHRLRFDFDLAAGKPYHFSIYRSVKLGQGDIELLWDATRTEDDWLELRVEVQNNTSAPVMFDCKLFPVGRPYLRFQVQSSRPGTTIQDVRVKLNQVQRGTEAWLRCEQIGDGRVLNYRIPL